MTQIFSQLQTINFTEMALSLVWKIHVNHNNIRMFPFKHCKIINICGGCVLGPLSPKIYTIKSIPMKQHIDS